MFSPDGKKLASAGIRSFTVWDAENGDVRFSLRSSSIHESFSTIVFSPDGKRLASARNESTIRIWNPESGEQTPTLRGHRGEVSNVAFSPDGLQLASVGEGEHRIWDARPWTPELKVQEQAISLIRFHRNRLVVDGNAKDSFAAPPIPLRRPPSLAGAALRKAISEDRRSSEVVRQRALDMIRD